MLARRRTSELSAPRLQRSVRIEFRSKRSAVSLGRVSTKRARLAAFAALASRPMDNPTPREPSNPVQPPPEAWQPMVKLARLASRPLDRFLRIEAASGILLLLAAAVALLWANSPWAHGYEALWQTPIGVHVGPFEFSSTLEWFVNDVLMAIFFLVVGMEIRGELHDGELSEWRRAALPMVCALGGMVVPALLYLAVARAPAAKSGWGIPMATDIAFAVGVLTLLGRRVPSGLRVLLLALAVIDDLGAILVIAFFYSSGITGSGLLLAALGVSGILVLRAMGVRAILAYFPVGALVWLGVYSAGVHPTIAGVIVGLLTPVRAWLGPQGFIDAARYQAQRVSDQLANGAHSTSLGRPLHKVTFASREAVSPAEFLIRALHPWVAFVIMPLFALANAGVNLHGLSLQGTGVGVSVAVCVGLVAGKPLGVIGAGLVALGTRLSSLPQGLHIRHLIVLGVVAGIGFTMSLFIAQLAFADPSLLGAAKLGVLGASMLAMFFGLGLGFLLLSRPCEAAPALESSLADLAD